MPIFLDTRGNTSLGIRICSRCSIKFPITELRQDPNFPGLWVCEDDLDVLDPWRLPARETERIDLDHPFPDVNISGLAPTPLYANPLEAPGYDEVTSTGPTYPWLANFNYTLGAACTPQSTDNPNTDLQSWWICIQAGTSGAKPPAWPTNYIGGQEVTDGTVVWIGYGIFPATAESTGVLPYNPPKPSGT